MTLWTFDTTHTHGRTGIRMYKAAADFDNVVVSPGPTTDQVYADRVATGGSWQEDATKTSLTQAVVAGTARRTTGARPPRTTWYRQP